MKKILFTTLFLLFFCLVGAQDYIGIGKLARPTFLWKAISGIEYVSELNKGDLIDLINYDRLKDHWKASHLGAIGYIPDKNLVQSIELMEFKKTFLNDDEKKKLEEVLIKKRKEAEIRATGDSLFLIQEKNRLMELKGNSTNISEYNVKAQSPKIKPTIKSKEQEFVEKNFPYIPISEWKKGMRFIARKSFEIYIIDNIEERIVGSGARRMMTSITLKNDKNEKLEHEFYGFQIELADRENIKGLLYLHDIDQAKELLLGKTLYILTPIWYVEEEGAERYFIGDKYIPVKITQIGAGKEDGPVKMIFRTNDGKEAFVLTSFSETNKIYTFGVKFTDAFSFTNPKNKYSHISSTNWAKIQKGKISVGMTEEEVKLSWGEPSSINRASYGNQWVYDNKYIYFKNKRVTSWN